MTTLKFDETNLLDKTAGVYMIQNILNGHKYVGSTNNFKRRLNRHKIDLRHNRHHAIPLQRAYNKYGEDKFIIVILERCEPVHDTLLFLEQKYLDLHPEYNCVKKASRMYSTIVDEKPESKRERKVDQYTLDFQYVRTFDSVTEAAKSIAGRNFHSVYTGILRCCHGTRRWNSGYIWKYTNDPRDIHDAVKDIFIPGKRVDLLDKNGNYIRTFNNMMEAARCLGSVANRAEINRVCLGQKRTAFGFRWRYTDGVLLFNLK